MSLVRTYDYRATAEAIERADGNCINRYRLVRNDVSIADWGRKNIRQARRNPNVSADLQWPGHKDVGHTFRHVEDSADPGKSVYVDAHTAISVTMQILNSDQGQAALGRLQNQTLDLYDNRTQRVTASVAGTWYGRSDVTAGRQLIIEARCELMKLGERLWVHSTYPCRLS